MYADRGQFVIVLRQSDAGEENTRQRFTFAHEMGHALLAQEMKYAPTSRGEYWRIERLCNDFAARLLVSEADLERLLPATPMIAGEILGRVGLLSKRLKVSVETAARRAIPRLDRVSMCEVSLSAGSSWSISWVIETMSWIAHGRGKKLTEEHALMTLISEWEGSEKSHQVSRLGEVEVAAHRFGRRYRVAAVDRRSLARGAPNIEDQESLLH